MLFEGTLFNIFVKQSEIFSDLAKEPTAVIKDVFICAGHLKLTPILKSWPETTHLSLKIGNVCFHLLKGIGVLQKVEHD